MTQDDINYHFNLGIDYYNQGKYELSFNHMLIASEHKISAQFNMGLYYEYGLGVEQSFEKASKWYTLSASQGNTRASLALKRIIHKRASNVYCFFSGFNNDVTIIHPHQD